MGELSRLFDWIPSLDIDWLHAFSPYGRSFTLVHVIIVAAITCLLFGILYVSVFLINKFILSAHTQSNVTCIDFNVNESTAYRQTLQFVKSLQREHTLDAIMVCGGGRPSAFNAPPLYVQSRCDLAVLLYNHAQTYFGKEQAPKILCLSAGTAHTPQLLHQASKLPIWESYASAQYILHKYASFVQPTDVYMETVSYDTIGNAYFAKTLFSDILKWKNIAVITNDWHFARTKAIFEWIYSLSDEQRRYHLTFVNVTAMPEKDLSESARRARMEREQKSLKNVYALQEKYNSLRKVHDFLHLEHSMYACAKMGSNGKTKRDEQEQDVNLSKEASKLMAAYGYTGGSSVDEKELQQNDDLSKVFENIQHKLGQKQSAKEKQQTATI